MAKAETKPDTKEELEEKVWSAIAAFEQILEAMPNDRASMEALAHAYEQVGDHTRSKDYVIRLGNILADEGDREGATELLDRVRQESDADERIRDLSKRIESMAAAGKPVAAPATEVPKQHRMVFSMADELTFAWSLLQANEISQEEYSSLVQDLTDMSAGENAGTISLLHVLEGRAFKNLDRIMAFASKDCGVPIIALSGFDIPNSALMAMPHDFMVRRGVLAFELLGKDALVVLMNPYDHHVRKDVETLIGKKCHFYMALPSQFDQTMNRLAQAAAEAAAQKEKDAPAA